MQIYKTYEKKLAHCFFLGYVLQLRYQNRNAFAESLKYFTSHIAEMWQ